MEIFGVAWSSVELRVLIVFPTWLDYDYLEAVVGAFDAWDRALESFGRAYGYEYLSEFEFQVSVKSSVAPGYDIVVYFEDVAGRRELGEAEVVYIGRKIVKAKIRIYLYTATGMLSPLDVGNVAMHEIGHALGLGHASSSETENGAELMYPVYRAYGMVLRPSTLDAYAIAVLYAWLERGRFDPPSRRTVKLPASIPYRMLLYYKVSVFSEYGDVAGEGWYLEGARVVVSVSPTVVELGEGVRAVFVKWSGDVESESPMLEFAVRRDVEIRAVWVVQYYVEVVSEHSTPHPRSGWYDGGAVIRVSIEDEVVCNGSTRYVFVGWTGTLNSTSRELEVLVDRPIELRAVWRTQYLVLVRSRFSKPAVESGWYDEGEVLEIAVEEEVVDCGNGTRMALAGWEGTIDTDAHRFEVVVDGPLELEAVWTREYYVEVSSPYGRPTIESGWYPEGATLEIGLESTAIDHGNGTRRVFDSWEVDGLALGGDVIAVEVDGPLVLRARWRTQYRVRIDVVSREGEPIEALLKLARGDLVESVRSGSEAWLDRGTWNVTEVQWLRVEVPTPPGSLMLGRSPREVGLLPYHAKGLRVEVDSPSVLTLEIGVHKVVLRLADLLGLPAPFLGVEISDGVVARYTSDLDGVLATTLLPEGKYSIRLSFLGVELGSEELLVEEGGDLVIAAPVSVYTILIAVALALLALRLSRRSCVPRSPILR